MNKLKFLFVLPFLTIVFFDSFGQSKNLDSLLNVLEHYNKEDTIKAKLIYKIGMTAILKKPKITLEMANKLSEIGRNLKHYESNFGSLELEASYYLITLKLDSAIEVYRKMKEFGVVNKNAYPIFIANTNMANVFLLRGKSNEAIEILKESLQIAVNDKMLGTQKGKILVNLANAYNTTGNRTLALETALQSIELNTALGENNSVAAANFLIGSIYGISGQFKEAAKYHLDYANVQLKLENWSNACSGYISVANDYKQLKQIAKAREFILKAQQIALKYQLVALQNKIATNLTAYDLAAQNQDAEMEKLNELQKYYEVNKLQQDLSLVYFKMANCINNVSDAYLIKYAIPKKAIDSISLSYLNKAEIIGNSSNNYGIKEEVLRNKSIYYEIRNDYLNAFSYYQKYITIRDSAINESKQVEIAKLNLEYSYNKKEDSLKLIQTNTDATLQKQFFLNKEQEQNILLQNKELLLNKQMLLSNNQELALLSKDKELQHLAYLKTQADLQTEQLLKSEKETQLSLLQKEKFLETAKVNSLSKENEVNILKRKQVLGYSIGILATLLFGGLYFFDRSKNKQIQLRTALATEKAEQQTKEAEFQKSLTEASLSALRSQMNPHFIFNCLNSIKLYTAQNDTEAASNYLTKFSKLIRMALENSRNNTIHLQDEIKSLELYIQLEAMRFKGKLNYKITIAENVATDFIEIPPMLLQPYVENAIWHGLMPKENGGTIELIFKNNETNDALIITIKDDGVGRKKASEIGNEKIKDHKSIGTKVTGERLALINKLFKTEASVHTEDVIKNNIVEGTIVTVIIPFSK